MSADAERDARGVPPVPRGLTLAPFRAFRPVGSDHVLSFNSFGTPRNRAPVSYSGAAAILADWIATGVLRQDATAGLYAYEQTMPTGQRVRGLLGALGLSPAAAGIVLPHEDTRPEPVLDRLALMETTGTDLEPILVVYDGGPVVAAAISGALSGGVHADGVHADGVQGDRVQGDRVQGDRVQGDRVQGDRVQGDRDHGNRDHGDGVLLDMSSDDGVRHRLAAITSPTVLAAIAAELLGRRALIADGHHRYASYLQRQSAHWAAGDGPGPWDFGLALLVDAAEDGLAVRAIHRVLENVTLASAVTMASRVARVTPLTDIILSDTTDRWLDRLTDATRSDCEEHRPAFVLTAGRSGYLVDQLLPTAIDAALPPAGGPALRRLNVTVLAHYLLPLLGVAEHEGREVGDPRLAALMAAEVDGTAILLPPITFHDVLRVASEGDRMPRKSTLFLPKPANGLVLRRLS